MHYVDRWPTCGVDFEISADGGSFLVTLHEEETNRAVWGVRRVPWTTTWVAGERGRFGVAGSDVCEVGAYVSVVMVGDKDLNGNVINPGPFGNSAS